jgi:hypothetical protein
MSLRSQPVRKTSRQHQGYRKTRSQVPDHQPFRIKEVKAVSHRYLRKKKKEAFS